MNPVALATILLTLLMTAGPARAQDLPPSPDELRARGLEAEPLKIEALGLIFNPPDGALFQVDRRADTSIVTIRDGRPNPEWSMKVQSLPGVDGIAPTPAQQVTLLLKQWKDAGVELELLENRPVRLGRIEAQIAYVRRVADSGEIVMGWLFLPRDETSLLGISMRIRPESFTALRDLFDTSFATLRLVEVRELADIRQRRLAAGQSILDSITEDRLRSLVGSTSWYRYYLPAHATAGSEDRELGYYVVEFLGGPLGAIDPTRNRNTFGPADAVDGLLVHVQGHYLEEQSGSTYDSDAWYWMAWDQSQEAWSIRGTRRKGGRSVSEALTGIRPPRSATNPAGRLTVINSTRDGATRDEKTWQVPEAYLSQAIHWALGPLLPRDITEPYLFSTYCYDNASPELALSMRVDQWEREPGSTGNWLLTSQTRSDAPRVVSTYGPDGALLRRQWPNGPMTEPMALEQLHALWVRKGLDTKGTLEEGKTAPRRRPGTTDETERRRRRDR